MTGMSEFQLTPAQLLVAMILADYASDDGSGIYPKLETVARRSGKAKRTVRRIVRELEATGLVVLVKAERQHRAREYRIDVAAAPRKAHSREDKTTRPEIGTRAAKTTLPESRHVSGPRAAKTTCPATRPGRSKTEPLSAIPGRPKTVTQGGQNNPPNQQRTTTRKPPPCLPGTQPSALTVESLPPFLRSVSSASSARRLTSPIGAPNQSEPAAVGTTPKGQLRMIRQQRSTADSATAATPAAAADVDGWGSKILGSSVDLVLDRLSKMGNGGDEENVASTRATVERAIDTCGSADLLLAAIDGAAEAIDSGLLAADAAELELDAIASHAAAWIEFRDSGDQAMLAFIADEPAPA